MQGRAVDLRGRFRLSEGRSGDEDTLTGTRRTSSPMRHGASRSCALGDVVHAAARRADACRRGVCSPSSPARSSRSSLSALPILTASVLAVAAAVLSGLLPPAKAYAGFANGTILLIVLAFLVARAVVKCGLGTRVGHAVVSVFGRSTLGLSYSIFLVDGLIAPAFPSNTARSGVIYPLAFSLAEAGGREAGRRRLQTRSAAS